MGLFVLQSLVYAPAKYCIYILASYTHTLTALEERMVVQHRWKRVADDFITESDNKMFIEISLRSLDRFAAQVSH